MTGGLPKLVINAELLLRRDKALKATRLDQVQHRLSV